MNIWSRDLRFYVSIIIIMIVLGVVATTVVVDAQEYIILANEKGVQKTVFARGEGIQLELTLPYSATVQVLLHNPPGTAGPSPTIFIPPTPVQANVKTVLGPRWLDERAPCGKYRLEIMILNPPPPLQPKTDYRYFDYAMNEPQCSPPSPPLPPTPQPDMSWLIIAGVSAVAIAAVVSVLILTRLRAPPPKEERAVIPPPVPTPPTTPSTSAPKGAPPKGVVRRTPIVRSSERDEERP
jgi:hypothetical protein